MPLKKTLCKNNKIIFSFRRFRIEHTPLKSCSFKGGGGGVRKREERGGEKKRGEEKRGEEKRGEERRGEEKRGEERKGEERRGGGRDNI